MNVKLSILALSMLPLWGVGASKALAEESVAICSTQWPPYYSREQPDQGPIAKLVKDAFKTQGYTAKITMYPWKRTVALATAGKECPVLMSFTTKNPEREKIFYFSDDLPGPKYQVVVRNSHTNPPKGFSDLEGKPLGVVRGYKYGTKYEDHEKKIGIKGVKEDKQLVKMLAKDNIDRILIDWLQFQHLLPTVGSYEIKNFKPTMTVQSGAQWLAFSKAAANAKQLHEAFNKGLKKINFNDYTK